MCCVGRDGALSPCSHALAVVSGRSGGGGLRTPALAGVREVSLNHSRANGIITDVYFMPLCRAHDPATGSPRSRWRCLRSSTLGDSSYVYCTSGFGSVFVLPHRFFLPSRPVFIPLFLCHSLRSICFFFSLTGVRGGEDSEGGLGLLLSLLFSPRNIFFPLSLS